MNEQGYDLATALRTIRWGDVRTRWCSFQVYGQAFSPSLRLNTMSDGITLYYPWSSGYTFETGRVVHCNRVELTQAAKDLLYAVVVDGHASAIRPLLEALAAGGPPAVREWAARVLALADAGIAAIAMNV